MTLSLRYGARSDVGLLRDGNEDAMYAGPRLLAVADGMGGHAAGEVASRVVIETVSTLDTDPPEGDVADALRAAVQTANGYLRDMVAADGALEGMGTTLTALLWVGEQLGLAHVGDSRGYLFREGRLELITHDHTLVQSLVDEGRISAEEATTHPQRSWITRALDGRPSIELDLSMRDAHVGDRYLLCSDGLSSYVSEQTIAEALAGADPQAACDRLIDLALRAGGPDNVTCIVADLVDEATEGKPIVGGAAADSAEPTSADGDHPAGRAAKIAASGSVAPPRHVSTDDGDADDSNDGDGEDSGPSDHRGQRRAGRRLVAVLVTVVLLVIAGAVAAFFYIRTQYYVAATDSSPATVGVYRGVSGSVLGIDLSRLDQSTDVPIDVLTGEDAPRVADGIQASDAADAQRIVDTLRSDACASLQHAANQEAANRRRHGDKKATPDPLPAYCDGAA